MKKSLLILFVGFAGIASAQQIALNSQYLFNEMLVNPGAAGSKEYVPVQLSYRKQWVNFPGSPTTQSLTSHGMISRRMAIGGVLFNDVAGPSRRTGINLNTAYHLRLDARDQHQLGFGLGLSLTQHVIDVNQLTTYLPDDPAVLRGYNNQLVPDANFGIYYHFLDKGYAGISAHNLVELKRDLYNYETPFINPLERNYYFLGGYNFDLGQRWRLKASTLAQMIETTTFQLDGTLLIEYNRAVWLGASYRHDDAVVFMAGGQAGPMRFGYSYDYTLSDIGDYSSGSHEVFIELQINKNKDGTSRTPWLKRNRIYSPKH
ncbi:MAG: type IX secretion system membrane protein PorP/SprF [Crocinitomicaceae bacterium]|jgi:type IX secretion system PorP/SprF family membrane protein|nr:type IX secretion system membrane protein PorP/SprF [Crocinitomicaceae bacterium]MDG1658963.1 type IX secretion system membrane protein PorP/SprF [Crocinitomicaceae bacterium]